jgi:hypothetical protein
VRIDGHPSVACVLHDAPFMEESTMVLGKMMRAIGAGAGAMYFLDPEEGRRRRALVRDQFVHWQNVARKTLQGSSKDLANRARGFAIETRKQFQEARAGAHSGDMASTAVETVRRFSPKGAETLQGYWDRMPAGTRSLVASAAIPLALAFVARRARLGRLLGTAGAAALLAAVERTRAGARGQTTERDPSPQRRATSGEEEF